MVELELFAHNDADKSLENKELLRNCYKRLGLFCEAFRRLTILRFKNCFVYGIGGWRDTS